MTALHPKHLGALPDHLAVTGTHTMDKVLCRHGTLTSAQALLKKFVIHVSFLYVWGLDPGMQSVFV
jgi:hypothetical protein